MKFTFWRLILWSSSVCLFGIVFAAPLRYYFVVRDPLRFPTGTAMAMVIGLLHRRPSITKRIAQEQSRKIEANAIKRSSSLVDTEEQVELPASNDQMFEVEDEGHINIGEIHNQSESSQISRTHQADLMLSFGFSGFSVSYRLCHELLTLPD